MFKPKYGQSVALGGGYRLKSSWPRSGSGDQLDDAGAGSEFFQRYTMVVGRVLVAMIFMMNALNIIGQALAAHEMAAHGVPASLVPALITAARALQLIAGIGLILGIYPPHFCFWPATVPDTGDPHGT